MSDLNIVAIANSFIRQMYESTGQNKVETIGRTIVRQIEGMGLNRARDSSVSWIIHSRSVSSKGQRPRVIAASRLCVHLNAGISHERS